jgi:threonylcarbamoyladenosine tRNA methylthiotransferase MtaB
MRPLFMKKSKKAKLAISTLGCKTNFYESAAIAERFGEIEIVDFSREADIYVINTCTVTNRTDYKSRNLIRKALAQKAMRPDVSVVVTGCFAQRSYQEILALGDVDFVVDNQSKLDIALILAGKENKFSDIMTADSFAFRPVSSMFGHTRAFQKIQDGCDFFCTYCAVPYARGHSRSARFEDVLTQAKLFGDNGFKEIVLGGVNLGLYRDADKDLGDVVEAMAKLSNLELIRISSIEPQLLSSALLDKMAKIDKLCPHFHIPLQSGSDSILQKMGRHYDTALVDNLMRNILRLLPEAAIGFDVICGFPGETDALFKQTYDFLEQAPIAYLHVFSYSKRKGTPAAEMPNQVLNSIKNQRTRKLIELSNIKKAAYANLLREHNTLLRGVNESKQAGSAEILSDHFLRVKWASACGIKDFVTKGAADCEIILD